MRHTEASQGRQCLSQPAKKEWLQEEDAPLLPRVTLGLRMWEPSLKPRGGSPFLGILENNEALSVSMEAQPDSNRAAVLPALKVTAVATVNRACVDRNQAAPEAGDAERTWEGRAGF